MIISYYITLFNTAKTPGINPSVYYYLYSVFRTAYVYVRNNFAGILKETDNGYSFKYDTDYLQSKNAKNAVSLILTAFLNLIVNTSCCHIRFY